MAAGTWSVVLREAARLSRRPRTFSVRVGASALIIGGTLLSIWIAVHAPFVDHADLGWLGRGMVIVVGELQMFLALVLAPLLAADAVIEERRSGSLELMTLSRLRPELVLGGNVWSRIALVLMVILGALPVSVLVLSLGGVGVSEVVSITISMVVIASVTGVLGGVFALFTDRALFAATSGAAIALTGFIAVPLSMMTFAWQPTAGATVSPLFAFVARDYTPLLAALAWAPVPWFVVRIGGRVLARQLAEAEHYRVFGTDVWGRGWWRAAAGLMLSGPLLLLAAGVQWTGVGGWLGTVSLGFVWLWHVGLCWVGCWVAVRLGTDIVHAADMAFSRRKKATERKSNFKIWANPVAWREARWRTWGPTMFPILAGWLVLTSIVFQGGMWVIPGGILAMGFANAGLALLMAIWLTSQAIDEERSTRSLALLRLSGLSDRRIVWGKVLGVAAPTLPMLLVSAPMVWIGVPHLMIVAPDSSIASSVFRGIATSGWLGVVWLVAVGITMWVSLRQERLGRSFGSASGLSFAAIAAPGALAAILGDVPVLGPLLNVLAAPFRLEPSWWELSLSCLGYGLFGVALVAAAIRRMGVDDV